MFLPPVCKKLGADDADMIIYANRIKTFKDWPFSGGKRPDRIHFLK